MAREIITTERLVLIPLTLDDEHVDALFAIRRDERVGKFIPNGTINTRQATIEWLESRLSAERNYHYLATVKPASPLATALASRDLPSVSGSLCVGALGPAYTNEFGYAFHPASWGRGIASEAVRGWLPKYLEAYGIEKEVYAVTYGDNAGSRQLLRRLGAEEGTEESIEDAFWGKRTQVRFVLQKDVILGWGLDNR